MMMEETHLARMMRADLIGMAEVAPAVGNGEDLVVAEAASEVEEDTNTAGKVPSKIWDRSPGGI